MDFFEIILRSIYDPSFYKKNLSVNFSSALKYFLLLCLFLTGIKIIILTYPVITSSRDFVNRGLKELVRMYPENLEIKIKNGTVTSNVKEPYFFKLPKQLLNDSVSSFVIDTHTPYSQKNFNKYHAVAWLTSDTLFVKEESQIRSVDLSSVKNASLSKSSISSFLESLRPWLDFLPAIILVIISFFFYLGYLLRLVYLFFLACLFLLVGRFLSLKLTYLEAYKIGLFCMTAGLIIELIFSLPPFFTLTQNIPFLFTIIALIVFGLNFYPKKPAVVEEKKIAKKSKKKK